MKIGNNPQKQLYENTKEIERLNNIIKEAYRTNDDVELNIASISVTKSLTNAGADVKTGWLFDSVGSLFKITGGDEDSLLLDFYSSLRGPQGEKGEDGADGVTAIDDNTTADDSTWSSSKIATELAAAGKIYYQHNIYFKIQSVEAIGRVLIINDNNTKFTASTLASWLYDKGITDFSPTSSSNKIVMISGHATISGALTMIKGVYSSNGTTLTTSYGNAIAGQNSYTDYQVFTDTVL